MTLLLPQNIDLETMLRALSLEYNVQTKITDCQPLPLRRRGRKTNRWSLKISGRHQDRATDRLWEMLELQGIF